MNNIFSDLVLGLGRGLAYRLGTSVTRYSLKKNISSSQVTSPETVVTLEPNNSWWPFLCQRGIVVGSHVICEVTETLHSSSASEAERDHASIDVALLLTRSNRLASSWAILRFGGSLSF